MKTLNERLKNARKNLNLSQEYVAKQLEINRSSLAQIESGKRKISAEELNKLSLIFGYSADELLNGNELQKPDRLFARSFEELDELDQREILSLIEFKKMMKDKKNNGK